MNKLIWILILFSSVAAQALETVDFVDLNQFSGRWYEIASNPQIFTPSNCMCTQQTLTPNRQGSIDVYNSCRVGSPSGELRDISGTAVPLDDSNSKLEVDFGLPFKGSYWVIGLASDYSWTVVSDERENSLFILSKTPTMAPDLYQHILGETQTQISTENLNITPQDGCSYP